MGERHGYYCGAHLHMFGQMIFFLEVARDIERICPNAWLIQSANPVFEGLHADDARPRLRSWAVSRPLRLSRHRPRLGLDLAHVTAQMSGFNHWIWMTDFRYRGEDAYPLIDE